ncbi:MAG: hypothetical protein AAGA53_07390 [Pseudomonadota bacterium]
MEVSRRRLLIGTVSTLALAVGLPASFPALSAENAAVGTDAEAKKLLLRMVRVVYPHDQFPDAPYERTVDAIIAAGNKTPGQKLMFAAGIGGLRAASFGNMDEAKATEYCRGIEQSAFFGLVRSTAVVALYNDQEVWKILKYEGPSFDQGGYIDRGFNDLDWLPDPRITEKG